MALSSDDSLIESEKTREQKLSKGAKRENRQCFKRRLWSSLEHILKTAKGIAGFRLLRDLRPSVPRYWSSPKVIAKLRPSLKRIVHGSRGKTRKRKAGQIRQGLTSCRVAPPCRPPAFLPCLPFFPWSNLLPSCPVVGWAMVIRPVDPFTASQFDVRFPVRQETNALGFHELAASIPSSVFYTRIHYLSPFDPLLGFWTWYREKVVGLRSALNRTWFISVFLRDSQRLTADQASSLLFLTQVFDPTSTCQRLAKLPYRSCFQVQFPLRIVGIHVAADLQISYDHHLGC
jgi:hypothetical protein